jgi:hypothetical protein
MPDDVYRSANFTGQKRSYLQAWLSKSYENKNMAEAVVYRDNKEKAQHFSDTKLFVVKFIFKILLVAFCSCRLLQLYYLLI